MVTKTSLGSLILIATLRVAIAAPPNVVVVLTDDQGYGDLSVHGNPYVKTPHLDALAKQSVRFNRFYVNSFCAPTRAALLTGRYPLRCGVWGVTHSKETMRASEVTLGEAFRAAGYRTGYFGKWHNGEQFPYTPPGQGFDEFLGFCNGHTNNYFDATLLKGSTPTPTKGYISDVLTDASIEFIKRNRAAKFFCFVSFNAPHSPYQVEDKYYDKFRAGGFDERTSGFYGMCENIDDNVGRLLQALDKADLAANTIVLFLTDNGGTAGVRHFNAGMRGGKTSVHEGGCRVPLFVRWPEQFQQPHVVKELASHIDIYPTLLDLCGIDPPDGPPIDGVSLRPLLEGRSADWPARTLFTHNPISADNRYPGAVRTARYRLVRTIRGPQGGSSAKPNDGSASKWMLFDMQADPGEKRDLAKQHPDIVAKLSQEYEAWYDDISREPLTRLPIQVGHAQENPVTLNAPQAYFEGNLRFDHGPGFAHDWLTDWNDMQAKVWFELDVVRDGKYEVELRYACPHADAQTKLRVLVADDDRTVHLSSADAPIVKLPHRDARSRERYVNRQWGGHSLGTFTLPAGKQRLQLQLISLGDARMVDLKSVRLTRLD